jgi:hypothetical protein
VHHPDVYQPGSTQGAVRATPYRLHILFDVNVHLQMKEHSNQACSDNTQKLKNIILHLLHNDTNKFVSELGWHNNVSA